MKITIILLPRAVHALQRAQPSADMYKRISAEVSGDVLIYTKGL